MANVVVDVTVKSQYTHLVKCLLMHPRDSRSCTETLFHCVVHEQVVKIQSSFSFLRSKLVWKRDHFRQIFQEGLYKLTPNNSKISFCEIGNSV